MKPSQIIGDQERRTRGSTDLDQSALTQKLSRSEKLSSSDPMAPIFIMVLSSLLFALMGVFVKLASAHYSVGELVFYRSLVGLLLMSAACRMHRGSLRTEYPRAHLTRSLCGAVALCLWFYSIGQLPLAMAMTLNYTAPVWMVLFLIFSARLKKYSQVSPLLFVIIAVGFSGVILILQPTFQDDQSLGGSVGLLSGVVSAIAFLQVAALGKVGEPGYRVVFYFSLVGMVLGVGSIIFQGGFTPHTTGGVFLLLAMGILAAAAQWSLTYAFLHGKTLVNASLQYLTIAFSSALGGLIFGDYITPAAMLGMVLITASGVMATYFRDKAVRKSATLPEASRRR